MGTLKDSQQVCITVYFEGSYMNHSPKHVHTWRKGSFEKFTLLSERTHTVFDWSMLKKRKRRYCAHWEILHQFISIFGRKQISFWKVYPTSSLCPHWLLIRKKEKVLLTLGYFKSICINHWFSLVQIPLLTSDSSQF